MIWYGVDQCNYAIWLDWSHPVVALNDMLYASGLCYS